MNALRRFTSDEVDRIIRRALRDQGGDTVSQEELFETAKELGIDPGKLETAIEQERAESQKASVREAWLKRQKAGFNRHLWSYVSVNVLLFLINLFTPGPWWFQWPLLGWGIGLANHHRVAFLPSEERIEEGIREMQKINGGAIKL